MRGKKVQLWPSHLIHVMWVMTLTLKDPKIMASLQPVLASFLKHSFLYLVFSGFLSLPTPQYVQLYGCYGLSGGGTRKRGGRSPVFRFTVPICQYFLIFQSPVLSREQLYCHPRGKSPVTGSSAISRVSPMSEREKSNMRGSPRWWHSQGQGDGEI